MTKVDLAEQVKRYVGAFDLNVVNSAKIQSTLYDPSSKRWKVALQTPAGLRSVVSKHLVLATGVGSQKPHLPQIKNEGLYKGVSIHSAGFKNAKELKEKEVKVKAPHQIRVFTCFWKLELKLTCPLSPSLSLGPPTQHLTFSRIATPRV